MHFLILLATTLFLVYAYGNDCGPNEITASCPRCLISCSPRCKTSCVNEPTCLCPSNGFSTQLYTGECIPDNQCKTQNFSQPIPWGGCVPATTSKNCFDPQSQ
ncbi:hypothetical protein L596_013795 [Steinernema carpocapsae]|uniref:TIL domain-containing protein n=1 Tax=Steinernema carpocapsae TaxID=34508 RepID=A0A4U5P192_STECR|nr:hypothetical protein L596_013795 [Steinernema carpocapsae]